jgi:hypothetical protein
VYQVRNKHYCVPHSAIAAKEPHKFREAIETSVRRIARQVASERAMARQIDAFEEASP